MLIETYLDEKRVSAPSLLCGSVFCVVVGVKMKRSAASFKEVICLLTLAGGQRQLLFQLGLEPALQTLQAHFHHLGVTQSFSRESK